MANLSLGKNGKNLNDRELAARARNLAIEEMMAVLKNEPRTKKFPAFKKALLLKLAPSLLPRLNEVSGNDGEPIKIDISKALEKVYGPEHDD